ncbi:hypothetical protein [Devosia marina]|uniref:Uncharacterized protein n=1 Tax=Devosia marina TaxID=2683198 RepID=A0A7X3K2B5_9HYPH|nr:hypothetical protein [Devosia marina]MVS97730.1 hypothetical protein [Devosia marina]
MNDWRLYLQYGAGWGLLLWLFGYLLGIALFPVVPTQHLGWYISPLGLAATFFVLWRWAHVKTLAQGLVVGLIWASIAVAMDYVFIVLLLQPADGYYKADVYLYYVSALVLPLLAGWLRGRR